MLETAAATADAKAVDAERKLTDGWHLVIDALTLNGIKTIYGVPGIPITDLGRLAQAAGMRVISFRHEQHAGNAAAIAGFLTRKPGICLTVSAPGFLNGLTALANDQIRALVEKSGIPFLPMSMAKGLLPDTHPQSAGAARSTVLKDADVVMLIGARLNWLLSHGKGKTWGEPGSKTFIQIDIEPREMDSNVEIAAPVVGDIGSCVSALLEG